MQSSAHIVPGARGGSEGAMTSTTSTFANQLRHFARAVDIVDDEIFDRVRQLIYKYVKTELGAAYFELMRDQPLDQEPALKMFWSSEDEDHLWPVRRPDGSYTNAVAAAFAEGQPIPTKYACDGADISPPLKWTNVPTGAKSLALICDDPDAPAGVWVHWVLYDLPPTVTELPERVPTTETIPDGAKQGLINDN